MSAQVQSLGGSRMMTPASARRMTDADALAIARRYSEPEPDTVGGHFLLTGAIEPTFADSCADSCAYLHGSPPRCACALAGELCDVMALRWWALGVGTRGPVTNWPPDPQAGTS